MAAIASSALDVLSRYATTSKPLLTPGSSAAKAKASSEEFEAVFLSSMFNEMFAGLKGDGPMGDSGAGVWRSFLSDEYGKSFAKSGGIGIGAEVYKTLLAIQEAKP